MYILQFHENLSHQEKECLNKAFILADKAHTGQKRKSGEPYICHPVEVANTLLDLEIDTSLVVAAILHDTVEDTAVSLEEITKVFGSDIAHMVDGVTKLGKSQGMFIHDGPVQDLKIESLRKWFEVMRDDLRVAVIKLADRLHNICTLEGHGNPEKERDIAQNTLDIYAKIAARLCINDWQIALEDASFRHISPEMYRSFSEV